MSKKYSVSPANNENFNKAESPYNGPNPVASIEFNSANRTKKSPDRSIVAGPQSPPVIAVNVQNDNLEQYVYESTKDEKKSNMNDVEAAINRNDELIETQELQDERPKTNANSVTFSTRLQRSHTRTMEYLKSTKCHRILRVLCVCCFHIQAFCSNKHHDFGLTWFQSFMKMWRAMTHATIHFGTMIFTVVMGMTTGLTAIVSFYIPFVVVAGSCVLGFFSLIFHNLIGVLLFDLVISIGGFSMLLNGIWRTETNAPGTHSTTEIIYGIIMFLIFPFRVTWWRKYYPNVFQAIDFHDHLMFKHLNITEESLREKSDIKVAMYAASQLLNDIDE